MKISNMVKKTRAYADAAKSSAERFRDGSSVVDSIKGSAADFKKASVANIDGAYRFVQSKGFKGYKRFRVSYYGYEPAEKGLKQFRRLGSPLDGAEILLKYSEGNFYRMFNVYVSGFFIGSVFFDDLDEGHDEFLENKLLAGRVTSAHIRFGSYTVFGKGKFGRTISEERDTIFLFLKAD